MAYLLCIRQVKANSLRKRTFLYSYIIIIIMTSVNVKDEYLLRWAKATGEEKGFPAFVNEQVGRGVKELEKDEEKKGKHDEK